MDHPTGEKCGCMCHKMSGIFIALAGIDFLLGALDVLSARVSGIVWPVLMILFGLNASFGAGKCKCCSGS